MKDNDISSTRSIIKNFDITINIPNNFSTDIFGVSAASIVQKQNDTTTKATTSTARQHKNTDEVDNEEIPSIMINDNEYVVLPNSNVPNNIDSEHNVNENNTISHKESDIMVVPIHNESEPRRMLSYIYSLFNDFIQMINLYLCCRGDDIPILAKQGDVVKSSRIRDSEFVIVNKPLVTTGIDEYEQSKKQIKHELQNKISGKYYDEYGTEIRCSQKRSRAIIESLSYDDIIECDITVEELKAFGLCLCVLVRMGLKPHHLGTEPFETFEDLVDMWNFHSVNLFSRKWPCKECGDTKIFLYNSFDDWFINEFGYTAYPQPNDNSNTSPKKNLCYNQFVDNELLQTILRRAKIEKDLRSNKYAIPSSTESCGSSSISVNAPFQFVVNTTNNPNIKKTNNNNNNTYHKKQKDK